jgi:DNA polymerase elongation subunit (family B)
MKDSVAHAHYDERRGSIHLVGRKGTYEVDWPDVFFLKKEDVSRLPSSFQSRAVAEGAYARVRWPEGSRSSRRSRLEYFQESVFGPRGLFPLEADVSPVQRYFVENPKVEFSRDWRLLWFDLETERVADWDRPWESRILSFSWRSSSGLKGHVRTGALTEAAERETLETFVRIANRHDVLLAWNGDRFDFPVVKSRMNLLGVEFDPGMYHWLDHLRLFKRYYSRTEDGSVTSSFSLDKVAEAFLGERKVPVQERATGRGWDGKGDLFKWIWKETPDLLKEYNDQDTDLMRKIEEKTGFIQLHFGLCRICRVLPSTYSLFPMTLVDGRMFQRGHEVGYHYPTKTRSGDDDGRFVAQARGAFVPEADVGLHESVAVLDYARMYPSIIRTFNMSLETLDPEGQLVVPDTDERGVRNGGVVARFRASPEGHLPAALRAVLEARKRYSDQQANAEVGSPAFYDAGRLSTACKVLANTFYGVILSPLSRYYRQEIGESVTSMGRYLLASTIKAAERRGHRLVFGDTDSVAIRVKDDEEAKALKDEMNELVIPEIVKEAGVPEGKSEVRIDYEKRYSRVVVTASKRYAGRFALYKGKTANDSIPPDIRGLEIVRSDVCRAARSLQREVLDAVLDGQSADALHTLVSEVKERFLDEGAPLDQLVLSKGLTKKISEYKAKTIQVKVAEQMLQAGMEVDVGQKIPFVLTERGALHPSEVDPSSIDRVQYWNKYIYPPSERVLESAFPGFGWGRLSINPKYAIRGQMDLPGSTNRLVRPGVRPIRKTRSVKPIRLVVPGDYGPDQARALGDVLDRYSGTVPVVVEVLVEGVASVDLDVPHKILPPTDDFRKALKRLGVRLG